MFHFPEASGNAGIPYAWASFPMFPAHGMVEKSNVNTGLFSLKPAGAGATMRGITGRNKVLADARVQLGPQQCIVLDASSENFQFRNVTFTGAYCPRFCAVRSSVLVCLSAAVATLAVLRHRSLTAALCRWRACVLSLIHI